MSEDIKVGDVVQLKSDGPKMTIDGEHQGQLHCIWFELATRHEGYFRKSSLRILNNDIKKGE